MHLGQTPKLESLLLHIDTYSPSEFPVAVSLCVETCVLKAQDLATLIRAKKLGSGKGGRFVLAVQSYVALATLRFHKHVAIDRNHVTYTY